MKKLMMAAIAFSFAGFASAQTGEKKVAAENITATPVEAIAEDAVVPADTAKAEAVQDKRTVVKVEDLPAAVQKTLASDSYAGWKATSAVWVDSKMPHYEIQLSKGAEKNAVKISKDGKAIA